MATSIPGPASSPIEGLSILLVEDEYLIALDAAEMLSEMGAANVRVASNFDEAQTCIGDGGFDIVILDVNLNGQLSVPLAETLQRRGTPFVFTTGYSLRHRPIPGLENAICVSKPYTGERLRDGLASALKNHAAAG